MLFSNIQVISAIVVPKYIYQYIQDLNGWLFYNKKTFFTEKTKVTFLTLSLTYNLIKGVIVSSMSLSKGLLSVLFSR